MATARRTRTIAATPQQRVGGDRGSASHARAGGRGSSGWRASSEDRLTQVFTTKKGRAVRIDFRLLESEIRRGDGAWEQEIAGTPFERVLIESITEIALEPVDDGTRVTIAQRQKLRGYSRTGGFLLRRATAKKLDEALDGARAAARSRRRRSAERQVALEDDRPRGLRLRLRLERDQQLLEVRRVGRQRRRRSTGARCLPTPGFTKPRIWRRSGSCRATRRTRCGSVFAGTPWATIAIPSLAPCWSTSAIPAVFSLRRRA